jgi:uncharacterized Zn finger protein
MAWDWDERQYFPPSAPLPAKGGIKARSKRGGFADNWWGKVWISTLESFQVHSRLARGRSYGRRGQVVHLEIEKRRVMAKVQGSRAEPYKVAIALQAIPGKQWRKVGSVLAANIAAAKLLDGQLPPEVENCFVEAGAPLFPSKSRDLITSCQLPGSL